MRDNDSATVRRAIALPSGFGLAALGVLAFSFSFPATSYALRGVNPYLIGVGRAAFAAVLAAIVLRATRAARPRGGQWFSLGVVAVGIVFGFPVLSTLALDHGSSTSHAAVVVGLLPVATAVLAAVRAGERPSYLFWAASLAGAAIVVGFTLRTGLGGFSAADALLFGALVTGGLGYAEGGRLARRMPGREVVSWALVVAAPVTVPISAWLWAAGPPQWNGATVFGMAYLSAVSMFLGFFAWYAGLARAGIARAGQVQLAQPLLTLVWSWLLLGERMDVATPVTAAGVLACVLVAQRARVLRDGTPSPTIRRRASHKGAGDGQGPDDSRGRVLARSGDPAAEHLPDGMAGGDREARGDL